MSDDERERWGVPGGDDLGTVAIWIVRGLLLLVALLAASGGYGLRWLLERHR